MSISRHLLLVLAILCLVRNVYSAIELYEGEARSYCDYPRESCRSFKECAAVSVRGGQVTNKPCAIAPALYPHLICCPRDPLPPTPSPANCKQDEVCLSPTRCATLTHDKIGGGILNEVCWSDPAMYCCPIPPQPPQEKDLNCSCDIGCGKSPTTVKSLIVPGNEGVTKDAKIGYWPWIGAIYFKNTTSGKSHFSCAGSLISDRWVLTAAHCCSVPDGMKLFIRFGIVRLNDQSKTDVDVYDPIIHPQYNSIIQKKNDIALLRLKIAVSFSDTIRPICLPLGTSQALQYVDGQNVSIIGWGTSENGGRLSSTLKATTLKVISSDKCAAKYSEIQREFFGIIGEKTICAGDSSSTVCHGDSGGPLMFLDTSTSRYYLGGIISFSDNCAVKTPAVFTKIEYYIEWIQEMTNIMF